MSEIGVVIVTYNPDYDILASNIRNFKKENVTIVVVNNGEKLNFSLNQSNFKIIELHGNKGIAFAQNRGVEFLHSKNIEYVFLADQDSVFPNNYLEEMINCWIRIEAKDWKIGALAPIIFERDSKEYDKIQFYDENKGISFIDEKYFKETDIWNTIPISSGLLTRCEIFLSVNGNREELFIDMVDMQFDFDLVASGFHVYTTKDVQISHTLGNITKKNFLWKKFTVTNHPVWREYFFFRNSVYLLSINKTKSKHINEYYKRQILFRLKRVFFEKQKIKRVLAFFKGIYDGKRMKSNHIKKED